MKRVVAMVSAMASLGSALYACSSQDTTGANAAACGDAATPDVATDSRPGADTGTDGHVADSSAPDGNAGDAGNPGEAGNSGDAGDAGPQPVALNLCGTFDAMWPAGLPRADAHSWPTEFIQGANPGTEGYQSLIYADCAVEDLMAQVPAQDLGPWLTQLEEFEYQLFGCPDPSADAGSIGFALVPPNLYGQPLTSADLDRLSDWYLEAVIQAVIDQAVTQESYPLDASYAPALLTAQQIESIRQALAAAQTLYPNIVVSTSFSDSMCIAADAGVGDAGAGGG
jgi:hypothetical protein